MPRQQQHVETLDTLTRDCDDMTEPCNDYTLNADSCWVTAGDVTLWIRRQSSGLVIVEAYESGHEMDNCLEVMTVEACRHSWIDSDNEGEYGQETCRICGQTREK